MKYQIKKAKSGIHINPKNKGKFTATKKKTGKSTEELTHSKNPLTRKRAVFAQNAKKWKHKLGGTINFLAEAIEAFKKGGSVSKKALLPKNKKYERGGSINFSISNILAQWKQ